ncbi:MAG TPA: hypothetical protein VN611_09915 [Patescibacteria group bacterium]|nr:hypothetical protein [Patescibacteria group bacterium]
MDYRTKLNHLMVQHRLSIKDLADFLALDSTSIYSVLQGEKALPRGKESLLIQKYHLPADYFRVQTPDTATDYHRDLFYQLFPEARGSDITYEKIREIIRILIR